MMLYHAAQLASAHRQLGKVGGWARYGRQLAAGHAVAAPHEQRAVASPQPRWPTQSESQSQWPSPSPQGRDGLHATATGAPHLRVVRQSHERMETVFGRSGHQNHSVVTEAESCRGVRVDDAELHARTVRMQVEEGPA